MDKLMGIAKKLDTFFKVLQKIIKITIIITVCVLGGLTIANIFNPNAIIATGYYSLDIGPITINLAKSYSPEDNNMVLMNAWIVMGLVVIAGIAVYYAFEQIAYVIS